MYLGEYYKSCEKMMEGQNWDKTNTLDMVNTRAFFSMAVTDRGIYAFGGEATGFQSDYLQLELVAGYNNYKGFLDSVEYIDMTVTTPAWSLVTGLALDQPKSHTCAASVRSII